MQMRSDKRQGTEGDYKSEGRFVPLIFLGFERFSETFFSNGSILDPIAAESED